VVKDHPDLPAAHRFPLPNGNLNTLLPHIVRRFSPLSETASLDAQVLAAKLLGVPRSWLLAHPEARLTDRQQQALALAVQRVEAGEALPYVLGTWEFFGLEFTVTPEVLIPRPETELLVEQALLWLKDHPNRRRIADIGTGSGCIAVTLAVKIPELLVTAGDISAAALEVARKNAELHGVARRVRFVRSDLLAQFGPEEPPPAGRVFDLLCANLPYIPSRTLTALEVSRKEPYLALDGGQDGLVLVKRLFSQLKAQPGWMADGGRILLEVEAGQGAAARSLARRLFPRAEIQVLPDLAGRDRLLMIDLPDRE